VFHLDIYNNISGSGSDHSCRLDDTNWKQEYGFRRWDDSDGRIHRDGDKPALLAGNIYQWYQHGLVTRDPSKGPAEIGTWNGEKTSRYYDANEKLHRDNDLPAVITPTCMSWYQHGDLHRLEDRPAVLAKNHTEWWIEGLRHRGGDQPAYIRDDGLRLWYQHGSLHRDDKTKPSIIFADGSKEYFMFGRYTDKEKHPSECNCNDEFPKVVKNMPLCDAFLNKAALEA